MYLSADRGKTGCEILQCNCKCTGDEHSNDNNNIEIRQIELFEIMYKMKMLSQNVTD